VCVCVCPVLRGFISSNLVPVKFIAIGGIVIARTFNVYSAWRYFSLGVFCSFINYIFCFARQLKLVLESCVLEIKGRENYEAII
jgi:hypothetical protein